MVADLDTHHLVKLGELLNWDFHVLAMPLWVLSTIVASVGSPFLSLTDCDSHEWVHLVQRTATIHVQVSALNNKSQPSRSWNDEATVVWLLNNGDLGLNDDLRLCWLHDDLRLSWSNDDLWTSHAWCSHANKLRSHVHMSTSVKLDELLTWSTLSKNGQGHSSLTNLLQWMTLILDNNAHVVLEHISGDLHELEGPFWLLTSMVARRSLVVLLADVDVHDGGHLVERTTDLVVQISIENVKFEKTHIFVW